MKFKFAVLLIIGMLTMGSNLRSQSSEKIAQVKLKRSLIGIRTHACGGGGPVIAETLPPQSPELACDNDKFPLYPAPSLGEATHKIIASSASKEKYEPECEAGGEGSAMSKSEVKITSNAELIQLTIENTSNLHAKAKQDPLCCEFYPTDLHISKGNANTSAKDSVVQWFDLTSNANVELKAKLSHSGSCLSDATAKVTLYKHNILYPNHSTFVPDDNGDLVPNESWDPVYSKDLSIAEPLEKIFSLKKGLYRVDFDLSSSSKLEAEADCQTLSSGDLNCEDSIRGEVSVSTSF